MSEIRARPRHIWLLLIGFTVWSGAFIALYGLQAVGCYFGWHQTMVGPISLHRLLLIGAFFLVLLAQGSLLWLGRIGRGGAEPLPFLVQTGLWASTAALVSAVIAYGPVFFVSTCL